MRAVTLRDLDDLLLSPNERLNAAGEAILDEDEDAAWAHLREAEVNFREFIRTAFHWRDGFIAVMTAGRQEELWLVAERLRRVGMKLEYE